MAEHVGENEEVGEGEGEGDYDPEVGEEYEEPLPDYVETEEELDFGSYGDEAEELKRDAAGVDDAHPQESQM